MHFNFNFNRIFLYSLSMIISMLVPTLIWLGTLFFIRDKTVFLRVLTAGVAVLALFTVARNIPLS